MATSRGTLFAYVQAQVAALVKPRPYAVRNTIVCATCNRAPDSFLVNEGPLLVALWAGCAHDGPTDNFDRILIGKVAHLTDSGVTRTFFTDPQGNAVQE
jgi:hypothetical protein